MLPSQILLRPMRHVSATVTRSASSYARNPASRAATKKRLKTESSQIEANVSFLLPTTLVAPPLWRYPRQPSKFVHMLWLHLKARFDAFKSLVGFKVMSAPKLLMSRPRFKAQRASAIPTAKALHVQMSEAFAAGDRESLRSICSTELHRSLVEAIDARPRGVRTEWELVKYDKTWYYPRLADWRIAMLPRQTGGMTTIKQAVVSISSVQRLARYDDTKGGAKINGSERVRHMLEHIVLQADINDKTYEHGPWRLWGTIPESTYESYLQEIADSQVAFSEDQRQARS
ncbi:hypothetical protein DL764_002713 [Monosporascus ibericus]|uniref:Tim44-like domain-containing protein n=1 Tax=Monosporascus ibericus TaxID=155417 RepID=A0A4Q4TJG0_9PEZI|nr:hypothetical protein DL764_002713 [Monosporascus ibericus]